MPLINCKKELKLKWKKYCVLSAAGAETAIANSNNFIFTFKDAKLFVSVVALSARDNEKFKNFLAKDLKDQFIGMNLRRKMRLKIRQMDIDIFSIQILLESIDYLF